MPTTIIIIILNKTNTHRERERERERERAFAITHHTSSHPPAHFAFYAVRPPPSSSA